MDKKKWISAINRFRTVTDVYDTTIYVEEALYRLVEIYYIIGLEEEAKKCDIYIQINTGREKQKAGILPESADKFITLCRDDLKLPVKGVMCIPPFDEDSTQHFKLLKEIADRNNIKNLSMGMSGDFEKAIKNGATHVRVGTAIFGTRPGY